MLIAKIDGDVITVADYRALFPNTSFSSDGPSASWLADNNCAVVNLRKPHDSKTQKLVPAEPHLEFGEVFTVRVEQKTQEDYDAETASEAARVRSRRLDLLKDSDWTQVADAPVDKTAWATYRQALRDVTAQSGFPWEVTWPVAP